MAINEFVEMHCHILPGVDDGSQDIDTSLKMIERLKEQGCSKIVLTPHYYSDEISLTDFLEKREKSFSALYNALPPGSPSLYAAAEVFISDYLFHNDNLDDLKFADSNYILIEHPFEAEFSQKEIERLQNLSFEYNAYPILAHIERYPSLMHSTSKLDDLKDSECLTQVNISSFTNHNKHMKKKLLKLLSKGYIDLIGSDCHNLTSRPPEYSEGIQNIIDKCGQNTLDQLIKNANDLLA